MNKSNRIIQTVQRFPKCVRFSLCKSKGIVEVDIVLVELRRIFMRNKTYITICGACIGVYFNTILYIFNAPQKFETSSISYRLERPLFSRHQLLVQLSLDSIPVTISFFTSFHCLGYFFCLVIKPICK